MEKVLKLITQTNLNEHNHQKLTIFKNRPSYTSRNTKPNACFCNGDCKTLGYCPTFNERESASDKANVIGIKGIPDIAPSE